MLCPICGSQTKVNDSRLAKGHVRRRRECLNWDTCVGYRFSTLEVQVFGHSRDFGAISRKDMTKKLKKVRKELNSTLKTENLLRKGVE